MTKAWHLVPYKGVKGIRWLAIALLTMGIVFRFANLDLKVYWVDETITSWRVSGYSEAQILAEAFTGDAIALPQLQQYQRFNPDSNFSDTLNSLATEAPQHPPLYYILTRFWVQMFGSSIAATRSLAALISLLAFPAMYWLCQELFACSLTGTMAVALLAVSPFHLCICPRSPGIQFMDSCYSRFQRCTFAGFAPSNPGELGHLCPGDGHRLL